MCRSVPHTPQAPILISAAFAPTFGHGTVRISGLAPGPAKVETRICSMPAFSFLLSGSVAQLANRVDGGNNALRDRNNDQVGFAAEGEEIMDEKGLHVRGLKLRIDM